MASKWQPDRETKGTAKPEAPPRNLKAPPSTAGTAETLKPHPEFSGGQAYPQSSNSHVGRPRASCGIQVHPSVVHVYAVDGTKDFQETVSSPQGPATKMRGPQTACGIAACRKRQDEMPKEVCGIGSRGHPIVKAAP